MYKNDPTDFYSAFKKTEKRYRKSKDPMNEPDLIKLNESSEKLKELGVTTITKNIGNIEYTIY